LLPVAALALGLLAWWLPAILAGAGALDWIVARAAGDLQGSVHIGSASLGWLRPIAIADVSVRDAAGQPVAEVPQIVSDRPLWELIRQPSDLGRFRLAQPCVHVVLHDGTSNVEQLLAKYLAASDRLPRTVGLSLEVADARLEIVDRAANRSWKWEKVALTAAVPVGGAGSIEVRGSAGVADDAAARLVAECKLSETASKIVPEIKLDAQSLPLEMFAPLVARFLPGARVAGRATCNVSLSGTSSLRGVVDVEHFQASSPELADAVQLRRVRLEWDLAWPGSEIAVKQLTADCELGKLSLAGTFSPLELTADKLLASLRKQTFAANARVDLAALAASLPRTLHIRSQTQITAGQLELAVTGRPDAKGAAWEGRVQAGELKALIEGRPVVWQQPIAVNFAVRDTGAGIRVETLKCQSSFFNLEAQGQPEELAAMARFDLGQLVGQLEQFVDLGGIRASGEGWAYLNWKSPDRKAFTADLECQARNFRLVLPQVPAWEEPNVVLFLSSAGQMTGGAPSRLESASLKATTAADQIEARLLQPIADWRTAVAWPIEARLQGHLEAWPARLRNWIDLAPWKPAGAYDLSTRLMLSTSLVSTEQTRLAVNGLSLSLAGLTIVEPNVQLAATGEWERSKACLRFRSLALNAASLAAESSNLVADFSAADLRLAGVVKYQGDLERLRQWIPPTPGQTPWNVGGRIAGSGSVEQTAGATRAALEATIEQLVVVDGAGQRFTEPGVRLAVRGDYDRAKHEVQLHECTLGATNLALASGGRATGIGQTASVDVNGTAQYDLQRLSDLLRPWIPAQVRFTGQGKEPFWVRGPLTAADAQGEAAVNWSSGYAYGFQAGPCQVKAKLTQGVIRCEPIACELSEGKARIAPRVRLAPAPAEVSFEPGLVAEQVRINPAMCQNALSYAAPALAGVATAEGRFSIQLERCRFPLTDWGHGDLAGKLVVHTVEVAPGPLVGQIASALGYSSPAKLSREASIPFWMQDRRIHHQGMELIFPDVTVRTSGSVGLDRSLALVVSMPVPQKWIGQNALGTALQNQVLELPVAGTLDRPQLDRRGIEEFSRKVIGTATRNLLQDRMKQQLDRLLPSR
jgi:hypothetical protein